MKESRETRNASKRVNFNCCTHLNQDIFYYDCGFAGLKVFTVAVCKHCGTALFTGGKIAEFFFYLLHFLWNGNIKVTGFIEGSLIDAEKVGRYKKRHEEEDKNE